jgi:hypothetical protein
LSILQSSAEQNQPRKAPWLMKARRRREDVCD